MNVYIIEKAQDYGPSIILGVFTTLEGAQRWIISPTWSASAGQGSVESARGDMDEYEPHDTVDAYWIDGVYTRIREVALQE